MHPLKLEIIDAVIKVEGGFVDHPADSGGPTKWGITEPAARRHGYMGDMRELPREVAFDIIAAKYWDRMYGDRLVELSPEVCREVVDTAINMGTRRAATFLQRALNALNMGGNLYPDLEVDGHLGFITLSALEAYVDSPRSTTVLVRAVDCLQGACYIQLVEDHPKNEVFVYGWLRNRVE